MKALKLAALALPVIAASVALGASRRGPKALPALGPLVTAIDATASLPALSRNAIELVPAIRPPTSLDGRVRIVVYLDLPPGAQLRTRLDDGAPTVVVPDGTVASRIEALAEREDDLIPSATWNVLDVRMTHFVREDEEQFRLLRPRRGGGLVGLSWPRTASGREQANEGIERMFEHDVFDGPADSSGKKSAAARLVRLNDCPSCHVHGRAEDRRPNALVQGGTDARGLFHLLATLSDGGPLERYRPRHPGREDPLVHVRCATVDVPRSTETCPDGLRPTAWLDIRAALAVGHHHVRALCASRAALAQRMDVEGRRTFRSVLEECGVHVD
jgi:hypothetical protein